MPQLKLIALDQEDLQIISAHLQDAIVRVDEMAYLPNEKRFVAILSRFDWTSEDNGFYDRRQAALRFEKIQSAQYKAIPLNSSEGIALELLAIDHEVTDGVGGHITLVFAGGGAIRLAADCVEAELRDLGPVWKTRIKPEHPEDASKQKQVR
ncbi:MAG: DUF2948 family protein [Hyphomicrobiales bacterium]|nr:DUF2948 family protein [Hyphomicrobiales bacterium]